MVLKTINIWTPLNSDPTTTWGVPEQDIFKTINNTHGLLLKRGLKN